MPSDPDVTSLTLLTRVQTKQPDAWERFVELYAPLVYHWCRRCDLAPEDTADVFQEVFRAVAEHIAHISEKLRNMTDNVLESVTSIEALNVSFDRLVAKEKTVVKGARYVSAVSGDISEKVHQISEAISDSAKGTEEIKDSLEMLIELSNCVVDSLKAVDV